LTAPKPPALDPSAFDDKDLPYPDVKLRPKGFVDEFTIAADAFVASNAVLMGTVTVGARSSVWYNCVLRGDIAENVIGEDTNIQDGTIVHCSRDLRAFVGDRVTVGHNCLIHACTVGTRAVIGMAASILDGATVGEGALVAAGSVVREGTQIPPGSFWAGVPAVSKGDVPEQWHQRFDDNWKGYVNNAWAYRRKLGMAD
jgi:carbonic anhydrase/acetyltransferase-like protein (isoleucine patch superfamily)